MSSSHAWDGSPFEAIHLDSLVEQTTSPSEMSSSHARDGTPVNPIHYHFEEIGQESLPTGRYLEAQEEAASGLSPRTARRLHITLLLPLPDLSVVNDYVRWHLPPQVFKFYMMNWLVWQELTGANTRMVHRAFAETGKPPLLWQFQFQIAPRLPLQSLDFPNYIKARFRLAEEDNSPDGENDDMGCNGEDDEAGEQETWPAQDASEAEGPAEDWEDEIEEEAAQPPLNHTDEDQALGNRFGFTPAGVAAMACPWSRDGN